jgi:hypothetical protein
MFAGGVVVLVGVVVDGPFWEVLGWVEVLVQEVRREEGNWTGPLLLITLLSVRLR